MLSHLTLHHFVTVDQLELEFSSGFSALTGETGAGKSILVDALSLAVGERADAGVIRHGSDRAEITAEFNIGDVTPALQWLKENDLESDERDSCFLRRIIDSSGRSRAYINGRPATLQQLRELGERLLDIHGQHAHQTLLRAEGQRELLDGYAGVEELAKEVTQHYRSWQRLKQAWQDWEKNASAITIEREQLQEDVAELLKLGYSDEEWEQIKLEHTRLIHAANLIEAAQNALDVLSEADDSCSSKIDATSSQLNALLEHDATLQEVMTTLNQAQVYLKETIYALRHYAEHLQLDPERLQEIEERLNTIYSTARKYRLSPEGLPELLQQYQTRLEELQLIGDAESLKQKEAEAHAVYQDHAKRLSAQRKKAALKLATEVTALMQKLAMKGGKFDIALPLLEDGSAQGLERIEFLVATHPGMVPQALSKVASGGELSRVSLALQVIMGQSARVPTLIFDEVDTGIGGGVAEIVGQLLRSLGKERQVLCVTHLPQVAAQANDQWSVIKKHSKDMATSKVMRLNQEQRIEEIARMLGGVTITTTTRDHAREMLER